jgi:hypothetical protein
MPMVGVLDIFFRRYKWTHDDFLDTREMVVDELLAWIEGEALAEKARKESGVKPGEEDIRVQAQNAGLPLPPHMPHTGPSR